MQVFQSAIDQVSCAIGLNRDRMRCAHKARCCQDYYFEFIYDDLPVWGFIGEKETKMVHGRNIT
eukprot:2102707-Rhodomonas_salina.1